MDKFLNLLSGLHDFTKMLIIFSRIKLMDKSETEILGRIFEVVIHFKVIIAGDLTVHD